MIQRILQTYIFHKPSPEEGLMRFLKNYLLIAFDICLGQNDIVFREFQIPVQCVFPPLKMYYMHHLFDLVLNEQFLQMLS